MGSRTRTRIPSSRHEEHRSSAHRHRKTRPQEKSIVQDAAQDTAPASQHTNPWSDYIPLDGGNGFYLARDVTPEEAGQIKRMDPGSIKEVGGKGWFHYMITDRQYRPRALMYPYPADGYSSQPVAQNYQQTSPMEAQYASNGPADTTYVSDSFANMAIADNSGGGSRRTPSVSTGSTVSSRSSHRSRYDLERIEVSYNRRGQAVSEKYAVRQYRV